MVPQRRSIFTTNTFDTFGGHAMSAQPVAGRARQIEDAIGRPFGSRLG